MFSLDDFINKGFVEKQLVYSRIYRYLDRYKVQESNDEIVLSVNERVTMNRKIWIYWHQGIENAPMLVKRCYESICRNKPENFEVVILSEKNLGEYIQLPDFIWEKYKEGYITTTHLSDIIRLELLYAYGGCWVDSTVFCSDKIPTYMLYGEMFLFKLSGPESSPILKMSSWWLSANKGNRLIRLSRQMLLRYWEQETEIRSYFLLHIIMSKVIDEDSASRAIFSNSPYFSSGNAHVLQDKLGWEYNEDDWRVIKCASPVHKLTYKNRYIKGDLYNFYSALLDGRLF